MSSKKFEVNCGNNLPDIREDSQKNYIDFWASQAKSLHWFKNWNHTLNWNLPFAKCFEGGLINASYNLLDVNQKKRGNKPAILWEGEDGSRRSLSYSQLFSEVKKFANVLKSLGVKKGDRITIYLPMVPELPISMLACSRIGAIHTVVFSGFSSSSLYDRIRDSNSKIVITSDGGFRKGKIIKLKDVVDEAISKTNSIEHVILKGNFKEK